jgi:phosphoglycerol transferase
MNQNITHKKTAFISSAQNMQMIILALFSFVLAWYLSGGLKIDFSIPLTYDGDALSASSLIKRLIDGAWYFNNNTTGFPFGSDFRDYPGSDVGSFLILKLIGFLTKNYALTYNLYYLIGFPVTAVVSFFVLRKFSVSNSFSFVGALLFTFLPFHFLRLGHLFYTWYFVVPFFAWFSLRVFSNTPPFFSNTAKWKSKAGDILLLLVLSSFGVYYAFFGVLMLLATGVIASIQQTSKKNILSALLVMLVISAGVGANLIPNIVYKFNHGANHEAIQRNATEAEIYGLKAVQLLLPHSGHRLNTLNGMVAKYDKYFPLVNENTTASLGAVGSIGFLMLICSFFLGSIFLKKSTNESKNIFNLLALLVLFLFLFATIGGFSVLIALITPLIRAWNRVSVFIGFLSITASMMVIDQYCQQLKTRFASLLTMIFAMSLTLFGLWDQTSPPCTGCVLSAKQNFLSDREFVRHIEHIMPTGAAIYQLPYMPFPETPTLYELGDYGLFRGYLNSTHLNWSYGGIRGRSGDLFFRELFKQPIARQVEVIKRMGFDGIYIDRRGYEDHGAKLEAELSTITGQPPAIISTDNNLVFFAISSPNSPSVKLPEGLNADEIMQRSGFTHKETSP